ncbi:MAG: LexA family transcriptional regulator [Planctomycetes bacterium]|nr:LexA family transcriptional regulator [Planctomycetota bacterium]
MDATDDQITICDRLREVREAAFGPRGRAAFARALGLSPSTYIYYEKGRVPPPDVLARAAAAAAVRLEWLITGQPPREPTADAMRAEAVAGLPTDLQAAVQRFAEKVGSRDGSVAAVRGFAELLRSVDGTLPKTPPADWHEQRVSETDGMIPILGRTAAGLVGRYEDLLGEEPAVSVADLAAKALGLDVHRRSASDVATDDATLQREASQADRTVALVQLNEPLPSGVVEFLDAPALRRRWPSSFAVRVDGESMQPRFRHGDVVIAAPGREVRGGQAALVQIRGRVGLTLKLVRREDDQPPHVCLVPINERYDTERLPEADIEWMAPVLFSVRF